jgi:hypothetical protein
MPSHCAHWAAVHVDAAAVLVLVLTGVTDDALLVVVEVMKVVDVLVLEVVDELALEVVLLTGVTELLLLLPPPEVPE